MTSSLAANVVDTQAPAAAVALPPVPIIVSLPVFTVEAPSGKHFEAAVTTIVLGPHRQAGTDGEWRLPLYYASLVAPRGQGTTLQGLFATLVEYALPDLRLEKEKVALAHRLDLAQVPCSWHCKQQSLSTGAIHAVLEPSWVHVDPSSIPARRGKGKRPESHATAEGQPETPCWLLLVPRWMPDAEVSLRHFTFLERRLPWPLWHGWATFLWERGLRTNEITRLVVQGGTETVPPALSAAYLCRPRANALIMDVQHALRTGTLPLPAASPLAPSLMQPTRESSERH